MAKTYKHLYPQICDFENLLRAYRRARKGKKQTPEMYAHVAGCKPAWSI